VGLWTGVENLFGNIAGIPAPLVTGFLIADTGSYAPGFDLAVVALVAGMISYWFVVGELKKPEP
jgi:MFS transporter, ACS family, D-galactonate transporter